MTRAENRLRAPNEFRMVIRRSRRPFREHARTLALLGEVRIRITDEVGGFVVVDSASRSDFPQLRSSFVERTGRPAA